MYFLEYIYKEMFLFHLKKVKWDLIAVFHYIKAKTTESDSP